MIEQFLEPVSTYAWKIDWLITMVTIIVMPWFFVTEAMFFWLIWRFRYKPGVPAQYVTGKEPHLKRWITIPHGLIIFLDLFVIIGAVYVWYTVKQDKPEPEKTIQVVGQQWAWSFIHPGKDGELGTADDIGLVDELHVVEDTLYHFELSSRDVLHSFSVPVFRLKQDAIPGRIITGWFEATEPGTYDIQCAEMCGIGHGIMGAKVVVHTQAEHEEWLANVK